MISRKEYCNNLVDLLFATLLSSKNKRAFYSILADRQLKRRSSRSIRSTLSRMKEKGYADQADEGWSLTKEGKKYFQEKIYFGYIPSPFNENSPDELIISFDIPEHKRKNRNWLRNQLKIFGYKMIQQSLWVGPGPLPKEFLQRLSSIDIKENVKTFKIRSRKM